MTRKRVRAEDLALLDAWLDYCTHAEQGTTPAPRPAPKGKRARHKTFGSGIVLSISGQTATERFDDRVERKLRLNFLELE